MIKGAFDIGLMLEVLFTIFVKHADIEGKWFPPEACHPEMSKAVIFIPSSVGLSRLVSPALISHLSLTFIHIKSAPRSKRILFVNHNHGSAAAWLFKGLAEMLLENCSWKRQPREKTWHKHGALAKLRPRKCASHRKPGKKCCQEMATRICH